MQEEKSFEAELKRQPKVKVRLEGSGYWEGGINGWFFRVRRGEETELPRPVAELIKRSERAAVSEDSEIAAYRGAGRKVAES